MGQMSGRTWARCVMGLEWVVAAEAMLQGAQDVHCAHRDVVFSSPPGGVDLRGADDVFEVWGTLSGLDHTRATLARFASPGRALGRPPLRAPQGAAGLRVSVSSLGRRNYNRYEVEEALGAVLARRLGLRLLDSRQPPPPGAMWCRVHLSGSQAIVGLRRGEQPLHRRPWRTDADSGALHPPVAACMALLAQITPGQQVLDPFAGSGTLLVEAAGRQPAADFRGCELRRERTAAARAHAQQARVSIGVSTGDAARLPAGVADVILSNPPWGRAVSLGGEAAGRPLHEVLLAPLRRGGRAVVLADQALTLPARIAPAQLRLSTVLRVSGRLADLLVIGGSGAFEPGPVGTHLAKAWRRHGDG